MALHDAFRLEYKRFKARKTPLDLTDVIDFSLGHHTGIINWKQSSAAELSSGATGSKASEFGLKSPDTWQIFQLCSHPGFYYITNPFTDGSQYYWCQRCVLDYPCLPNVCNLDAHHCRPVGRLWDVHRSKKENEGLSKDSPLMRLRWVTLGYHYDWDKKVYHSDHISQFPEDLAGISKFVAQALGFVNFRPEAAIMNFYHMDSNIGGHTDHSEFDLSAPLLSFSFGQEAIFLLGGESPVVRPVAIRVRSGDLMVMAGPSRLSYHGVPRILRDSKCRCNSFVQDGQVAKLCGCSLLPSDSCIDVVEFPQLPCAPTGWDGVGKDSQLLLDYMHHSRVNVNVRQVLPPGGTFPAADSLGSS